MRCSAWVFLLAAAGSMGWIRSEDCSLHMVSFENGLLLRTDSTASALVKDYVPFKTIICTKAVAGNDQQIEVIHPYHGFYSTEVGASHTLPVVLQRTDPSKAAVSLADNGTADFHSQFHISTHLNVGEWYDQMPIGNGRIGAFVGGNAYQEIVPLSVSNFFGFDGGRLSQEDYQGFEQYKPSGHNKARAYFAARNTLMTRGDYAGAKGQLSALETSRSMGEFQGIMDIVLAYSSSPIKIASKPGTGGQYQIQGRGTLMNSLKHQLDITATPEEVLLSKGELDMRTGMALEQFIIQGEGLKHVFREWFASEHQGVIVGNVQCKHVTGDQKHCLYAAMRVARGQDKRTAADHTVMLSPYNLTSSMLKHLGTSQPLPAVIYEVTAKKAHGHYVPLTVSCAVVICNTTVKADSHAEIFLCNQADSMHIVSTTVTTPSLGMSITAYQSDVESIQMLRGTCRTRLEAALGKGIAALKRRHIKQFAQRMEKMSIGINTDTKAQPSDELDAVRVPRMFQLGRYLMASAGTNSVSNLQGIWADGKQSAWNGDFHFNINLEMQYWSVYSIGLKDVFPSLLQLVQKLAHQGRYGARTVFGMNDLVGYDEKNGFTFSSLPPQEPQHRPLVRNNQRLPAHLQHHQQPHQEPAPVAPLATVRFNAQERNGTMMDNPAWVGNGYTDSRLKGEPLGELQWSLCVTCGAWLSTHLFEYLLFTEQTEDTVSLMENDLIPLFRGLALFFKQHILVEYTSENKVDIAHTGPTTSPENSLEYSLGKGKDISFITMTPAIDISVIREIASMYRIMLDWLPAEASSALLMDQALSADLLSLAYALPNNGLPTVSPAGVLLEYPDPFITRFHPKNPIKQLLPALLGEMVFESLDRGHRHFSAFHHLYPAIFHPIANANEYSQVLGALNGKGEDVRGIYQGSKVAMMLKSDAHGGHTSWSASWEAAIYARLFNSNASYAALTRLMDHFVTNNYLSLHPTLNGVPPRNCKTCFHGQAKHFDKVPHTDKNVYRQPEKTREKVQQPYVDKRRSFDMVDGAVFQMDGNMGFVSAVMEMLVHHHRPQILHILPALPTVWESGHLKNIQLRGHRSLDIAWKDHRLQYAVLTLHSLHPWNNKISSASMADLSKSYNPKNYDDQTPLQGFYRGKASDNPLLHVYSPNAVKLHTSDSMRYCKTGAGSLPSTAVTKTVQDTVIDVPYVGQHYPCVLVLCDELLSKEDCHRHVDSHVHLKQEQTKGLL